MSRSSVCRLSMASVPPAIKDPFRVLPACLFRYPLAARLLVDVAEGGRGVKGIHLAVEEPPLSTADIIRGIRARKGMSPWLFPLPDFLLRWCLTAVGRRRTYQQLYGDLEFEGSLPVE